jgi:hypothetical protein
MACAADTPIKLIQAKATTAHKRCAQKRPALDLTARKNAKKDPSEAGSRRRAPTITAFPE